MTNENDWEPLGIKFSGVVYEMRFTDEESRALAEAAAFHEMKIADYVRHHVMPAAYGAQVKVVTA